MNAESFAKVLLEQLALNAPYDTGNLRDHITLVENGNEFRIIISQGVDYAPYTNYSEKSKQSCKRHDEIHYHWIEKTISQVVNATGGNVINELED